jgi:hypothetical protein
MAILNFTIAVSLSGGPSMNINGAQRPVEAFDKLDVELPAGPGSDTTVDLQPGDAQRIVLLVVRSTPAHEDISFVASDGTADSDSPLTLDQPQTFLGSALELFGVAPRQLKFTNDTNQVAVVEILVVRNAKVPPP